MKADKNKSKKKKAPELVTYLELNRCFGYGYQARMVMDGMAESILDTEPFNLADATAGVAAALEEINRATGYNYKTHEVIRIDGEALEVNRKRDLASAKVMRDIERGRGELTVPSGVDYKTEIIDGEEEVLFSGRGTVLMIFFSWRDDKMPKAREALQRYCQHLAIHGYGGSATEIWEELEDKDNADGANWIKATHGKYVKNEATLINYMLGL